MSLSISEVQSWTPGSMSAMADEVTARGSGFEQDMAAVSRQGATIGEHWHGPASDAAVAAIGREGSTGKTTAEDMFTLADALSGGAKDLDAAKQRVLSWRDQAQRAGLHVADDGTVTAPAATKDAAGVMASVANPAAMAAKAAQLAQLEREAAAMTQQLRRALASAQDVNRQVASSVRKAVEALREQGQNPQLAAFLPAAMVDRQARPYLDGQAKLPTNPVAFAAVWSSFSTADKNALAAKFPMIGNHDGMPSAERDLFNRKYLATTLAALKAKRRQYAGMARPGSGDPEAQGEEAALGKEIDRLEGIKAALTPVKNQPARFLLHVDDGGRVAIAVNNPDLADNTATLVPGVNTTAENFAGVVQSADAIHGAATRFGHDPGASVVAWMNYNPPGAIHMVEQGFVTEATHHLIDTAKSAADYAAPRLDSFQQGLVASHVAGHGGHFIVAHSLGTTAFGASASGGHAVTADKVALIAAPGLLVDKASQLHLVTSAGHAVPAAEVHRYIWAGQNPHDSIPLAGNPKIIHGLTTPLLHDPFDKPPLGIQPTNSDFGLGAHQHLPAPSNDAGPRWLDYHSPPPKFAAHALSNYLAPNSPTLHALGDMFAKNSSYTP